MKLIITEKPSVAAAIKDILDESVKKDGYYESKDYIVTWCLGHLVSLAPPEMYQQNYKTWNIKDLPICPMEYKLIINKSTEKQYKIVNKLMNDSSVDSIICATDAGREGELIFRYLYEKTNCKKPVERLWTSSLEKNALKEAIINLKPMENYDLLYASAKSRSIGDWLIGINATRFLSLKCGTLLPAGRVQTPTLSLLVDRYLQIKNFIPVPFYTIRLNIGDINITSRHFDKKEDAEKLLKQCLDDKKILVSDISEEIKKKYPPLPLDLTTLQREANRFFAYTASQTLEIAQSLYENKLITYPRTESRYLTKNEISLLEDIVKAKKGVFSTRNFSRLVNDDKVQEHHALLPTRESLTKNPEDLLKSERNIYNLILMRLLVSLEDANVKAVTHISAKSPVSEEIFTATYARTVTPGFKILENNFLKDYQKDENNEFKEFNKDLNKKLITGQICLIMDYEIIKDETKSPKIYTEDTLLSAMERAGREAINKNLDVEKTGLGTAATRAETIDKIIISGCAIRDKKNIIPTEKGIKFISIAPYFLKDVKTTAYWENELTLIASGKTLPEQFINAINMQIDYMVKKYELNEDYNPFKSNLTCPVCGSEFKEGKKAFYCTNKECGASIYKKFLIDKKIDLSIEDIKNLFQGEKILKNMYSPKTQKYYPVYLLLEKSGKWLNFKLDFAKKQNL